METTDKRAEPRIANSIRFFVHVNECADNPDIVGVSVECNAVDVSTKGLQFRTEIALPPQSLLNITIGIPDPFAMYLLLGEVRWNKESSGEHYMGVLLQDQEGTDYQKGESDFKERFTEK